MTKKTGKSKSRNKDRRHLKAVPPAPKMPLQLVMNHRVVDSMALDFMQWPGTEAPDPADAFECLELVKLFLTAQHAINGSSSATAIDSDGVEQAAGAIAASFDPDDTDEAFDDIYFALHSYIHFLDGTGRWSGTDAAYEELHAALGRGIAAAIPQLPVIQVPDLTEAHQEAAFNAMPLIQRASALLDWLGTGREITSTGALRLKDIEPAAAAVGVRARGKRGGASQAAPLFDLETAGNQPETLLEVGTMHDVPVLREIWEALVGANLITLGSTKATPGPEVTAWNSSNTEERVNIRRMLSVVLLVGVLTDDAQEWDQEAVAGTLLAVLTYGTTDEPMPVAELAGMATPDLENTDLENTDLEDTHLVDADLEDSELKDTALEEIYASFAALQAQHKLTLLAELGLVEAATEYRVPPVAIQCLDLAMGFFNLADEPSDATEFPSNVIALHGPSHTGGPAKGR